MRVEEDVLESKSSQDFIFLFLVAQRRNRGGGASLSGLDIKSRVVSVFDETFTINTRVDDIGHTREIGFFSIHATLNQLKTVLYKKKQEEMGTHRFISPCSSSENWASNDCLTHTGLFSNA